MGLLYDRIDNILREMITPLRDGFYADYNTTAPLLRQNS